MTKKVLQVAMDAACNKNIQGYIISKHSVLLLLCLPFPRKAFIHCRDQHIADLLLKKGKEKKKKKKNSRLESD